METKKVREYIMVKNEFEHPSLEEIGCYDWTGDLVYTDEVYRMLKEVFKMDRLSNETSYVVALDHARKLKGVCRVGLGDISETPTPMQSIFSFLLLVGAQSFYIVHNHVSYPSEASESDMVVTRRVEFFANMFSNMEFTGDMIINPNGYIIAGGEIAKARREQLCEELSNDTIFNTDLGDDMLEFYNLWQEMKNRSKKN